VLGSIAILQNRTQTVGAPGPAVVSIVKASTYPDPSNPANYTIVENLVRDAVSKAGGLTSIIRPGDRVLVKPNLVVTNYGCGSGVVTDKRVVEAVVKLALEAGASKVIIAEASACYTGAPVPPPDYDWTWRAFKDAGLDPDGDRKWEDHNGNEDPRVELYDMNKTAEVRPDNIDPNYVTWVDLGDGLLQRGFYVPNVILNRRDPRYASIPNATDVFISVPILKSHSLATTTGATKNYVGTVPSDIYHMPGSPYYKHALVHNNSFGWSEKETVNRAIVDLFRVRPADFTVVDGLIGLLNGPVSGDKISPYTLCILAGRDAVAVDVIMSLVMGIAIQGESCKYLQYFASKGVGQTNPAYITVVGNSVASVRNLFPTNYGGSVRVDLTPPTLSGFTPANGSTVSGLINVVLQGANDNKGIIKAELYIDGQLYYTDVASPWSFAVDTSQLSQGSHTFKAVVYDDALNEASVTQTLNVDHSWSISITATAGSYTDTFTFGCKNGASDYVDSFDVLESLASPYISLASLMSGNYYQQDFKPLMTSQGQVKEWQVALRTDLTFDPISSINLSWSGVNWMLIDPTFELRLIDCGTSWSSIVGLYDMRSTTSVTLPVSGTGLIRCLKIQAVNNPISTIANVKRLPDNTIVELLGKVVTVGNDQLLNTFYISDPDGTNGIRVTHSAGAAPTVTEGDIVNVRGTIATLYGERFIGGSPTVTVVSTGGPAPRPKAMVGRNAGGEGTAGSYGLNNIGSLVKIWGRVTSVSSQYFYVDDGSGRTDGVGTGIRVYCGGRTSGTTLTMPTVGEYVVVTGVLTGGSGTNGYVPVLRPRKQAEIVRY
jgi:uncharacterized protein (DUF362 family)